MPRYHIMADIPDLNILGDCLNSIQHYGKVEAVINSVTDPKVPRPAIDYGSIPTPFAEIIRQRNAEIIEKFKAGGNRTLLAQEYNLCYATIHKIVYGIKRDEPEIPTTQQKSEKSIRNAEIIAKYESGTSSCVLAEEYGITRERVCQILRRVNAIGNAQARKEAAQIGYAEAAAKIKADIAQELETKINEVVELVRSGLSIRRAAKLAMIGNHTRLTNTIGKRIAALGIENRHGRHRNFSQRKQAVQALFDQGMSNTEIVTQLRASSEPKITITWLYKHMPELKSKRRKVQK